MKALEILKNDNIFDENYVAENNYKELIKESIKELEELQKQVNIITEDKITLKDYVFTNCNDCINKVDNKFTPVCFGCKRYYGCIFKKK